MAALPRFPLTIFFDGSCSVCSREMAIYRKKEHGGRLSFVDISAADFDPAPFGRSRETFMAQLHVRDTAGRYYLGVDGFRAIWLALPGPGFRLLAVGLGLPGLHLLATCGYHLFARLRRYLPRNRELCRDDSCHLGHRR